MIKYIITFVVAIGLAFASYYDVDDYMDTRKINKIEDVFREINSFISDLDVPIAEFHFKKN